MVLDTCKALKGSFESFVREKCVIPGGDEPQYLITDVYRDFFNRIWHESEQRDEKHLQISRKNCYVQGWTMFTTNYDTCLEQYWQHFADARLNTGFRFRDTTNTMVMEPDLIFDQPLNLITLHGSRSWILEPDGTIVEEKNIGGRRLVGDLSVGPMMIYPLHEKELYLEPYVSMLRNLNHKLKQKDIWITIGYSFNDPVIREIFIKNYHGGKRVVLRHPDADSIRQNKSSEISSDEIFLLKERFGEGDFRLVNYKLINQLKSNPEHSPDETM